MHAAHSESVPPSMRQIYATISGLIDAFCRKHLNDEYAALSRQLAAALARKRPSPLVRGKPDIWACAMVYALGTVNFLFDKSQTPHLRADDLCERFGVSKSSAANKTKLIRELFDMIPLDPRWCLPSRLADNPMAWMIQVNGLIIDARYAPREIQEAAYQRGLIPYIPSTNEPAFPRRSEARAVPSRRGQPSPTDVPHRTFKVGDSVIVKAGVRDPDYDIDIGGWQGRIVHLEREDAGKTLVRIQWDSVTLGAMAPDLIDQCEEDGLDWAAIDLYASEVEPTQPPDAENDVIQSARKQSGQHRWAYLQSVSLIPKLSDG